MGVSAAEVENLSRIFWEHVSPNDRGGRLVRQVAFYGTWSSVADRGMKLENGNLGAWKVSAVHSKCLHELSAKIPEPYGWPTVCTRGTDSSCLAKSGNTSNFRTVRCSSLDFRRRRSVRVNDFGGVSGELNCGTRVGSLVRERERERERGVDSRRDPTRRTS